MSWLHKSWIWNSPQFDIFTLRWLWAFLRDFPTHTFSWRLPSAAPVGLFVLLCAYGLSCQRRNGPCKNFLDRFQMAPRTCRFCFDLHGKPTLGAQKLCVSRPVPTKQQLLYSQGSKRVRQHLLRCLRKDSKMESFLKSPWSVLAVALLTTCALWGTRLLSV